MPYRRGQTKDKITREHKRQAIQDRGVMGYVDQVAELNQEVVDLREELGQANSKVDKYKARLEAEQAITDMYMKIAARRTKWLGAYMLLAAGLTGYLFYLAAFTKVRF